MNVARRGMGTPAWNHGVACRRDLFSLRIGYSPLGFIGTPESPLRPWNEKPAFPAQTGSEFAGCAGQARHLL
jgi:hypothetical protein